MEHSKYSTRIDHEVHLWTQLPIRQCHAYFSVSLPTISQYPSPLNNLDAVPPICRSYYIDILIPSHLRSFPQKRDDQVKKCWKMNVGRSYCSYVRIRFRRKIQLGLVKNVHHKRRPTFGITYFEQYISESFPKTQKPRIHRKHRFLISRALPQKSRFFYKALFCKWMINFIDWIYWYGTVAYKIRSAKQIIIKQIIFLKTILYY